MADSNPADGDAATAAARRLLEIVNGSWMSQAVYVAARLGIADLLAEQALPADALAAATGAHAPSLDRLLRALVSIDVCAQEPDGRYRMTPMGALLGEGSVPSLRAWTLYWGGAQWPVWGNLLHSVRTGGSARSLLGGTDGFAPLEDDPEAARIFNRAMAELTRLDAGRIVTACGFAGTERVMEVGGGNGALLAAILAAHPRMHGVLFDRPHAMEGGQTAMATQGVDDRCESIAGDFFAAIPDGMDVYVLKSVIHDWDDTRAAAILRTCRKAMRADALLMLVERIVPARLAATPAHRALARADLNLLVGVGGRERTEEEYRALLDGAGLRLRAVRGAGPAFSVIEAVPGV